MRWLGVLCLGAITMQSSIAAADASTIEYRPLDQCAPPKCRIETRRSGDHVIGSDKTELFSRRSVTVAAGETFAFDLPRSDDRSAFEMHLASGDPKGGTFEAALEVAANGEVLLRRKVSGRSAEFALPRESTGFGREERYFVRVREDLPSRRNRGIAVTVRNEGKGALIVASPLVLRRVTGRAARHAVLVILDAVPYPLLMQSFTGGGWLSDWIAGRGLVLPRAMSPGQLTGSFVRRFFKADYFRLDGEPSLAGQGFFEAPPDVVAGPVARLAEQGFVTVAIGSNLYLTPVLGRIGFDANYNLESTLDLPADPPIVARRFDAEVAAHSEDDALFVVRFGNTHIPWREGKAAAPPIHDFEIPRSELDAEVLSPIWKNLSDTLDSLREVKTSAGRHAPSADRIWIISADHGHTFTREARGRPWRLTGELVERDHMHCCLSSQQEARTPMVVITENGAAKRGVVEQPISTLVAWRAIEMQFGVDLSLPKTSAFAWPGEKAFDDGVIVSVGNSGTIAARGGNWSYRSYEPARHLAPVWSLGREMALLLTGSPARMHGIASEELYDLATDPAESNNRSSDDFADLVRMHERVTDWLAEYADTPDRPRFRYGLGFASPVTIGLCAPRAFSLAVDGRATAVEAGCSTFTGSRFEIHDGEAPLGVVDLSGGSFVVRCRSSGLPVAAIAPDRPRLNLALARTNCPTDPRAPAAPPAPGEALFDATLVSSRAVQVGAGGRIEELRNALRRWGYVRDK